ncbi:hypothetical protein LTS14_004081 [Recurvomyces mirabilis]|uniref:uncharacterized protein n=1 Tax=Recurvomyces mirabilis TaxID=574656 RepID=UPI002DE0434D|nr:hypothetical protein LTS14_004081 [Recurvomyces mirabilis]
MLLANTVLLSGLLVAVASAPVGLSPWENGTYVLSSSSNTLSLTISPKRSDYVPPEESSDDSMLDVESSEDEVEKDMVITEAIEQDLVRKGTNLLRWISQSATQATQDMQQQNNQVTSSQSQFSHYADLRANGWVVVDISNNDRFNWAQDLSIEQEVASLGFDTTYEVLLSTNKEIRNGPGKGFYGLERAAPGPAANLVVQRENYLGSGPADDRHEVYSPRNGAILGVSNDSPQALIKQNKAQGAARPPALNHWSDVAFLEYSHLCEQQGHPVQNLRYMFRFRITNIYTRPLIFKILDSQTPRRKAKDLTWQHRLVFDMTRVRSVTVFFDRETLKEEDSAYQHPTLPFEFEDVVRSDRQVSKWYVDAKGKVQKPPKKDPGGAGGSRQSARLKGQQAGQ